MPELPRPVTTPARRPSPAALGRGRRAAVVGTRGRLLAADRVLGLAKTAPATPVALGPPRFVDEAVAAGVEHAYAGEFPYFVGGGVAAFDCDDDGRPDLYFAGGASPRRCSATGATVGGALAVRARRRAGDRPRRRSPAPTRSTSTATAHRPRRPAARARTSCCAGSATAGSSARTRPRASTAATAGRSGSARPGKTSALLPTLAFGDYIGLDETRGRHDRAATTTS